MLKKGFQAIFLYLLLHLNARNVDSKIIYHTKAFAMISKLTTYVPRVLDKTCYLRPDEGPCRAKLEMWSFRPMDNNCSTFTWGGCQGNGNRFFTYEDCINTCISRNDSSQNHFFRPKWCSLRFDYGYCFGDVKRWYYDELWGTCKETIYSGCGGNRNNFYSKEQCDNVCRFGNSNLGAAKDSDDIHKRLIVNPRDTEITEEVSHRTRSTTAKPSCDDNYLKFSESMRPVFSDLVQMLNESRTKPTIFYDIGLEAAAKQITALPNLLGNTESNQSQSSLGPVPNLSHMHAQIGTSQSESTEESSEASE